MTGFELLARELYERGERDTQYLARMMGLTDERLRQVIRDIRRAELATHIQQSPYLRGIEENAKNFARQDV